MNSKMISKYCKIPITFVLKHGQKLPFDIFLRLSDAKVIKLSHKDDIDNMIRRYHEKGIQEVFVNRVDFETFLRDFDSDLTKKFFKASKQNSTEALIDTIEDAHKILKEGLVKLGANPVTVNIAKQTAIASLELMEKTPSIFKFFRDFEKRNSKHFLRALLVGYTSSCIIDTFPWQSQSIKEKATIASFLSDVFLEDEDFEELNRWERGEITKKDLSKRVLEHPKKMTTLLEGPEGAVFPNEVVTMISQHHERPDGTGFPNQIQHNKMILLSCIQVLAYNFILLMDHNDFEVTKKEEILEELRARFPGGNFKKAFQALQSMFGD